MGLRLGRDWCARLDTFEPNRWFDSEVRSFRYGDNRLKRRIEMTLDASILFCSIEICRTGLRFGAGKLYRHRLECLSVLGVLAEAQVLPMAPGVIWDIDRASRRADFDGT